MTTSVIKIESSGSLTRSLLLLHHPTRVATAEYPILRRELKKKEAKDPTTIIKEDMSTAATAGASADLLFGGGGGNGCEEKTADQPADTP